MSKQNNRFFHILARKEKEFLNLLQGFFQEMMTEGGNPMPRPHSRRGGISPRFCVFPGYKWCGPGCSGPGAPINAVDAACKAHDECYRKYGNYCACDQAFIKRLTALQNPYTQEGRHARKLLQYMKIQRSITCFWR